MALINCPECKKEMSSNAGACPHCGYSKPKPKQHNLLTIIVVGVAVAFVYYSIKTPPATSVQAQSAQSKAKVTSECSTNQITITTVDWSYENECRQSDCYAMKGAAVVKNNCSEPIGVQLKITGYDVNNNPILTRDFWPASTSNLPTGNNPISLDQALDHDARITDITLQPIRTKSWRQRN